MTAPTTPTSAAIAVPIHGRWYPRLVLAMLLIVYIFNWLDRQILGILAPAIKADLGLSNTQLGLLGGLAFAALYSTLAIPLAVIADRTSRTWVITLSMVVWSGFTALCGMANSFWSLFLFRLGVGVGEAGGVAPSYAIISQYFPPERRARAISIYSLGIPVGLACGVLFGAAIARAVDWRAAFIVVGLAGVIIAPIFRLVVKEPPRVATSKADRVRAGAVFAILARKPSFWLLAFAAAMSSTAGYGLAFWTPSILMQTFGFDLSVVSYFVGSLLLVGGVGGVFLGGVLADRLGKADRGAYAGVSSLAWVLTAPLFIAGFLSSSPTLAWGLLLIPNALNILFVGPVTTAVQHLVPPQMRATAAACFMLINNLVGIGAGSWLLGGLSDVLTPQFGAEALRYSAIALVGLYFVASALALFAVRPLRRDWVEEPTA
ncbi:spinster family MFS transporter [Brevundimonas lenta]|uniref:Putative MFS family arabinose efflux permease n=1 Tax=Brevundimonas lenta TaxID=424796 RepID=A0A7W6JEV5_9CAUL|nr:MFS transporter [Brevundimonas lenta]MBB4082857.1 putative MFS family arabinose efflux permease [Brevundimonas lenta]